MGTHGPVGSPDLSPQLPESWSVPSRVDPASLIVSALVCSWCRVGQRTVDSIDRRLTGEGALFPNGRVPQGCLVSGRAERLIVLLRRPAAREGACVGPEPRVHARRSHLGPTTLGSSEGSPCRTMAYGWCRRGSSLAEPSGTRRDGS